MPDHQWAQAEPEQGPAPPERAATEPPLLGAPQPAALARAGVGARAAALGQLQRSAGNRAVAAMLMRAPGPIPAHVRAEPRWKVGVTPGGTGAGRERDLGQPAKIFRGDTLTVTATWPGLKKSEQGLLELSSSGGVNLEAPGGRWISNSSYQWSIQVMKMGSHKLQFWPKVEAMLTAMKEVDVKVVTDVTDLGLRASAASDIAAKKFSAALAAIGDATTAWTTAYKRHEKGLKDADAAEKLDRELIMGLFFAALGGGAGGALGGWLKGLKSLNDLGKKTSVPDIITGGITDAAKDTLKYVVRTSRKLDTGTSGGMPETSGDSTDAPKPGAGGGAPGGETDPAGDPPTVFLGKLHAQLGAEAAAISGELASLKLKASDARAAKSVEEFDEDPMAFIEADQKLALVVKDLKADPKDYLKQLWGTWLGTFSYKIGPGRPLHIDMEPALDEEIKQFSVHKNISGPLNNVLRADAAFCGSTLEKWMDEFTPALRKRLEDEAKARNKAEWDKYWGEKAEQERKRREAEQAAMDMD